MHMADALISPAVGGVMWAATAGLIGYCAKKVHDEADEKKIPLMGVTGAFIFAAQMINFTIPATGSSGHLGGGMILAILLGPHAAFLTIASVLIIQALFFADGGLLALGCNIFNLGFFPAFIAYPFIYKLIAGTRQSRVRIITGSILAAVVGLQLGALGVVFETVLSGISRLPFIKFILFMLPIHLGIGIVEGIATAGVVLFVWQARPEILNAARERKPLGAVPVKRVLVALGAFAVVTGGIFSWFASTHPDGLEWSMFKTAGVEELESPEHGVHSSLAKIQEKTSIMPDYSPKKNETETAPSSNETPASWPGVDTGTSLAGIVGGLFTLLLAVGIGFIVRKRKKKPVA